MESSHADPAWRQNCGLYQDLNVKVDSDSHIAVKLINEDLPVEHPDRAIVEDAKLLLTCTLLESPLFISIALQLANQCAGILGRMGMEQSQYSVITANVLPAIRSLIIEGCLGVGKALV